MLTIGLTGGIGSGKSTVANYLVKLGLVLIDADAISRACTQPGGVAIAAIRDVLGADLISAHGDVKRDALRQRILQDAAAKTKLEAIIHPLVGEQIRLQLAHAEQSGQTCAVVDIPLLVEGASRWRSRLDAVWVIDCLPATQIERVRQRSAWPVAQIEAIMAAQASREQRLACADAVIFNDVISLNALYEQTQALLKQQKPSANA